MIVFTYPGQGSQKEGMGQDWVNHPSWELVQDASTISGRNLSALLLEADDAELKETKNAQLATFLTSMVIFDALQRVGVEAAAHAGHSLGEYSALTASGAIGFEDAVTLVTERGEAMQVCAESHAGTMAAILGLDDELVESACHRVDDDVWVANYNAPGQVVIAGSHSGIESASEIAKELGAKRAMKLPVSGAFHTPFMEPARDRLRNAIDRVEFWKPDHPVFANVDAIGHENGSEWPALLSSQLTSPVRWKQILHQLGGLGFTTFVEVGPGSVLTGMTKRTLKDSSTISISSPNDVDKLLEMISGAQATIPDAHEGEHLFATERLVVSPCAGIFSPTEIDLTGKSIETGFLLGHVNETEVRSAFSGEIQGFLAVDGERVTSSQPIAWLRILKK
jgi:[acyl-carrier-protein] S-malonyltransferase